MKKKIIIISVAVAVVVLGFVVATIIMLSNGKTVDAQPTLPLDTVLTVEQAEEDLAFMYEAVKNNHPCYIDSSGLDKVFDDAYENAKEKLSDDDSITVRDLWEIGANMYCSIEDGHTLITFYDSKPITESEKLLGRKIISVDGIAREELLTRFKAIFPCEPQVDFYVEFMLDEALKLESWNGLLGIDTSDGVIVETESESGTETLNCSFGYESEESDSESSNADVEAFYSYEFYEENSAAVFTLDKCTVTDGYKNALEEFFRQVSEKNIRKVAVDLRRNGGGNSQVINEFMRYIDIDEYCIFGGVDARYGGMLIENKSHIEKNNKSDFVFSGELYALTSNYTFSSAMDFAVAISDNNIGKIVGEIPGNMPTCYGDKLSFQTPNSKLLCGVSYKKFYRVDRTKDSEPLIPHIETEAENAVQAFIND